MKKKEVFRMNGHPTSISKKSNSDLSDHLRYYFENKASKPARVFHALQNKNIIDKNICSAGPHVLNALFHLLEKPYASPERENMDHLASVSAEVLKLCAQEYPELLPLQQHQVNRLLLETILTDILAKGRMPKSLSSLFLAPLWDTRNNRPFMLSSLPESNKRTDNDFPFSCEGTSFQNFWESRKKEEIPFLAGVVVHGFPHFFDIYRSVSIAYPDLVDAKKKTPTQTLLELSREIYASVLGHHMAGFIAYRLAQLEFRPDFKKMNTDHPTGLGHLKTKDANTLLDLYEESIHIANMWRPRIEKACIQNGGLSEKELEEYMHATFRLRNIIHFKLPSCVRWQLIGDDTGQFTMVGIAKWIRMALDFMPPLSKDKKSYSNEEFLSFIYEKNMVMPYLHENQARGYGQEFIDACTPAANVLGVVYCSAQKRFRHARENSSTEKEKRILKMLSKRLFEKENYRKKLRIKDINHAVEAFRGAFVDRDFLIQMIHDAAGSN